MVIKIRFWLKNTVWQFLRSWHKLFDKTENSIGKIIEWNQDVISGSFQITGIFKSPPGAMYAQFDLLFNYDIVQDAHLWLTEWRNSGPSTFVVVKNETDVSVLNDKIKNYLKSKSPGLRKTPPISSKVFRQVFLAQ